MEDIEKSLNDLRKQMDVQIDIITAASKKLEEMKTQKDALEKINEAINRPY
jgi:phage-related tail protein